MINVIMYNFHDSIYPSVTPLISSLKRVTVVGWTRGPRMTAEYIAKPTTGP